MKEKRLIRAYRLIMPRALLHHVSSESKDRLLLIWRFLVARPSVGLLWHCLRAWALRGQPVRAIAAWDAVIAQWQPRPVPELVHVARRRALLNHAACQADPVQRAQLLEQVLQDLDSPNLLKTDRMLLACLRAHVAPLLAGERAGQAPDDNRLRRLVLCVDILKTAGDYMHGQMILAICANLLKAAEGLEIDLVITNEWRAAGQSAPTGLDDNGPEIMQLAQRMMGAGLGSRFRLHLLADDGLAAITGACQTILALKPDVVLFGGGHRGPVSNESRAVRHCLFDHVPVAFFFFQASDQVDPCSDLVIARGPHRIEGQPGHVAVRVQPYPTRMPDAPLPRVTPPCPPGSPPQIVSALVGERLSARLEELGQRDLARFLRLLDVHPQSIWHFIGAPEPDDLCRRNPALARHVARGQVKVHPVLPGAEFDRLVGQASLMLHLPGFTGGSGGAGRARQAGVPILTFRHSDVAGRQPPETVFDERDLAGCIALARRILTDETAAARISAMQSAHSRQLCATAPGAFLDCLSEARERGVARLGRFVRQEAHAAFGPH